MKNILIVSGHPNLSQSVATSTMYDMAHVSANSYEIKLDPKGQYDPVPALLIYTTTKLAKSCLTNLSSFLKRI